MMTGSGGGGGGGKEGLKADDASLSPVPRG